MIPIILGAIAALVAVVVFMLKWETILDWFNAREALRESDHENIAFTLQEKLANGKYSTVEGIFNKRTETLEDGKKYESKEIDEQLAEYHRNEALVVYG